MIGAPMAREERAGPVVWTAIIGVTCLLLVLLGAIRVVRRDIT